MLSLKRGFSLSNVGFILVTEYLIATHWYPIRAHVEEISRKVLKVIEVKGYVFSFVMRNTRLEKIAMDIIKE